MREDTNRTHPVHEDMRFQRRSWALERIGWIVLGALVCAGLLGVFSQGPLSEVSISTPDHRLSVQYDRFQRKTRGTRFTLTFGVAGANLTTLRLSASFQDSYEITAMQPTPDRSSAGPEGLELAFAPPRSGDLTVVMWARPQRFGLIQLSAQAEDSSPASFSALVYP